MQNLAESIFNATFILRNNSYFFIAKILKFAIVCVNEFAKRKNYLEGAQDFVSREKRKESEQNAFRQPFD